MLLDARSLSPRAWALDAGKVPRPRHLPRISNANRFHMHLSRIPEVRHA